MAGDKDYEIVVAGGGIAGLSAGLAAARLGRRTLVLTGDVLGGQLLSIEKVEGYPGFPDGVPGYDLCPMAQEQAVAAGAECVAGEMTALAPRDDAWALNTPEGEVTARAVILATGTHLKTLGVPGEERLTGKGVSHCATCDAPLLRGKIAAVVGGGDSALQEALTLAGSAERVILLHRGEALTGQADYHARVEANPKIELRPNTTVAEILGEDGVTGIRLADSSVIEVAGVFVYVGLAPNTAVLDGMLTLDNGGRNLVDGSMRTGLRGVLAAGTVRAGSPGRAVAAAGDGTEAAIAADRYLADGAWTGG
jgi:thioredoxin reductase (NADPH)